MTHNFYSDLSNDFSQLLETEIDYNVVIQVGQNPEASKRFADAKMPGREISALAEERTKVQVGELKDELKRREAEAAELKKREAEEQKKKEFIILVTKLFVPFTLT